MKRDVILVSWAITSAIVMALVLFAFLPHNEKPVSGSLPEQTALIDTYLASGISDTDTTMTLASGTTRDGATLSGYYCFTIDANTPLAEFTCGTVAGTAVSAMTRGIKPSDPTATSSSLIQRHRRLASVQVTDFPFNQLAKRLLSGTDGFTSVLKYDSELTFSNRTDIVDKGYADDLSFTAGGNTNADLTLRGLVQVATNLSAASGTVTGVSGAYMALTSAFATSSCQVATSSALIVQNNGKIHQNCLDLTKAFSWSGLHTFSAGLISMSSSTFGALNVTSLNLPSSNTATSTATIGCTTFYATSTASPGHLFISTATVSTTTFAGSKSGFNVLFGFGTCP